MTDPLVQRARDSLVNAVRRIHHNGESATLQGGKWCVADGEIWPCPTLRELNNQLGADLASEVNQTKYESDLARIVHGPRCLPCKQGAHEECNVDHCDCQSLKHVEVRP